MLSNLFRIPANVVIRRAVIGLSTVVLAFALFLNSIPLWILAMICMIVVYTQNSPEKHLASLTRIRPVATPFLDPLEALFSSHRESWPQTFKGSGAMNVRGAKPAVPCAGLAESNRMLPARRDTSALEILLFNTPPICLN